METLNLGRIPFSGHGSLLTIQKTHPLHSSQKEDAGWYLRALYEDDRDRLLFRLSFDGSFEGMHDEYNPCCLNLVKGSEEIQICAPEIDTLRFFGKCSRFEMYMSPDEIIKYNAAMFFDSRHIGLNTYMRKSIVYALKGSLELDAPWGNNESNIYIRLIMHPDENGEMDIVYKDFRTEFTKDYRLTSFEEDCAQQRAAFEKFLANAGECSDAKYADAFRTANYILWSNMVMPNQLIRTPVLFANKNWSCEARQLDIAPLLLALGGRKDGGAWEHLYAFRDEQDATGGLPSWIGAYRINNRYVAPPAEGIAVRKLIRKGILNAEQMQSLYDFLEKLADFWKNKRDYDKDGIPEYCHPNESCCPNCEDFANGGYIEAPELTALLILLEDCLSVLAGAIGKDACAEHWAQCRDHLLKHFVAHSYDAASGHFFSCVPNTHEKIASSSLMRYIPILLGTLLPEEVLSQLVNGLENSGLVVKAGITSQPQGGQVSPYWMLFIVEGLIEAGFEELAQRLARSFCDDVVEYGFFEAFNAKTGEGCGSLASSATAAVFLVFLRDLLKGVNA